MEAPENIYLEKVYPDNGVLPNGLNYNQSPNDIEYTRTDAFMEKALDYIENNIYDHYDGDNEYGVCGGFVKKEEFIDGFKNFMKGE